MVLHGINQGERFVSSRLIHVLISTLDIRHKNVYI